MGTTETPFAEAVENTVIQLLKGGGSLAHARRDGYLDKVNEIVRLITARRAPPSAPTHRRSYAGVQIVRRTED